MYIRNKQFEPYLLPMPTQKLFVFLHIQFYSTFNGYTTNKYFDAQTRMAQNQSAGR